ncbi:MAG: LCP family protein [Clostridiales bacterium]|nr:LCP family protein [Clostridiales bacterium]
MMEKKPLVKILTLSALAVVGVLVVVVAALLSYNFAMHGSISRAPTGEIVSGGGGGGGGASSGPGQSQSLPNLNVLLLGFDNYGLSDTMLVVHFNGERGSIDAISIPRDTQIQLTEEQARIWREMGSAPSTGPFRINELPNRTGNLWGGTAGNANRLPLMKSFLEPVFGIEFDYYVTMNLAGFRNIVDAIDGLYVYVERDLHYVQAVTGWTINLRRGYQRLDGRQAEQLVRARNVPGDDFFRMGTAQNVMRAFFVQVLDMDALMSNPLALARTFLEHVNTDIGIRSIESYLRQGILDVLDAENVNFHMIPGEMRPISPTTHRYFIDIAETQEKMRNIVAGTLAEDEAVSAD